MMLSFVLLVWGRRLAGRIRYGQKLFPIDFGKGTASEVAERLFFLLEYYPQRLKPLFILNGLRRG